MEVSKEDLIYIAGFTDGEGHIGLTRDTRIREPSYSPRFDIENTNCSILRWIRHVTGLGIIDPRKEPRGKGYKHSYILRFRVEEIRVFLPVLRPYLKGKYLQADLLMEYLALESGFNVHNPVPEDISIQRKLIWEDLRELNKTGV